MAAKRPRAENVLVDALRNASAPCIVASSARASGLAAAAAVHSLPTSDLLVFVASDDRRTIAVPDESSLERLLDEAAFDVEARMGTAIESLSARLAACEPSVYEMVRLAEEEALACGLARRHGVRLALEAVLGHDASSPRATAAVKELAASVHSAAAEPRAPVATVLALLDAAGAAALALNVLSVLCFGDALGSDALMAWEQRQQQQAADGTASADVCRLRPLLEWQRLQLQPTSTGEASEHGDEALSPAAEDENGGERDRADDDDGASDGASDWDREGQSDGGGGGGGGGFAASGARLWRHVAVHGECAWQPSAARPALVAELGATREGVVVLDGLVDDALRADLLRLLLGDARGGAAGGGGAHAAAPNDLAAPSIHEPPAGRWERTTVDSAGLPRTWGIRPRLLRALERRPPRSLIEVHTRLARLYPEYDVARIEAAAVAPAARCGGSGGEGGEGGQFVYSSLVANAAVYGHCFCWHVDADPAEMPPSAWRDAYGDYTNGASGRPLLVSLLVYVDDEWRREWDAETLFLDDERGVGVLVQPRPGRCVLMHQDVLHRVSAPSLAARRPRYSLVLRLCLVPKEGRARERESVCRPEWGAPARFG